MSNGELQGRIGQLLKIRPGTMNPVLINTKPSIAVGAAASTAVLAQKLNAMTPLETYGSLVGVVTTFEPHNIGQVDVSLFPAGSNPQTRGVAYVYIDVLHSTYSTILTDANFKNFLTAVEVLEEGQLVPGARIVVSFKSTDYSKGSYVKTIDNNGFIDAIADEAVISKKYKPCIDLKSPTPRSTPDNFTNQNVGYFQALYYLAKWQIKWYNYKITEIIYPFAPDSTVAISKINKLLTDFQKMNNKFMKELQQNANPQKQWVTLVAQLSKMATYTPSDDPRIIIKVATEDDLAPAIKSFNNYTLGYSAEKIDDRSFGIAFPKKQKLKLGVQALLALTHKNLKSFGSAFEKIMYDVVEPNTLANQTAKKPQVEPTNCDKANKPRVNNVPNGQWTQDYQMTTNFQVRDFDKDAAAPKGASTVSGENVQANIQTLAQQLEVLHEALGGNRKITVTGAGGYQPPLQHRGNYWKRKNKFYSELPENKEKLDKKGKVIGARKGRLPSSQHRLGMAADIQVSGMKTEDVWFLLKELMVSGKIINGGLGYYPGFIHYDIRSSSARWYYKNKYPSRYGSLTEAKIASHKVGK